MTEAELVSRLALYLEAERKILEGNQSWTKDGVTFERANLYHIREEISKIRAELTVVQNSGSYGCNQVIFGGR